MTRVKEDQFFNLKLPTLEELISSRGDIQKVVGAWWDLVDEDKVWQDRIFDALSAGYAFVGLVALVRITRYNLLQSSSDIEFL